MKILSIGNSFSQDAHRWLHKLAQDNGVSLETINLYIGGCSLEMHWKNVLENSQAYDMEGNGGIFIKKASIDEALESDKCDIITLQQVSGLSGIEQSYFPYIENLADLVRTKQPNAKLYFHKTWSYETDSSWSGFVNYDNDQKTMYQQICDTTNSVAKIINAEIIPAGDVIQSLRDNIKEFDYKNGGLSLCRDGGHLSYDYGRFAAAATWLRTVTGGKIKAASFEDFNTQLLSKIIKVINEL